MSLHIECYGRGDPLVLFHGWGFNTRIWYPIKDLLAQKYQLFLVDLPGFGASTFMSWEAFKQALMKQLPTTFSLMGWSMGGLYATRFAFEEPDCVSSLVNICSSPYFLQETQEEIWPGVSAELLDAFYEALKRNPAQTVREFVGIQLSGQELDEQWFHSPIETDGLDFGLQVLQQWDLRALLSKLSQPVCYIFGRLDAIIPRDLMKVMPTIYPHMHYACIKKAGHIPFLSHPNEFITIVDEFLQ